MSGPRPETIGDYAAYAAAFAQRYGPDGKVNFSTMEWPALLRQLDRDDPSYKT